jgi:hypothetical protein
MPPRGYFFGALGDPLQGVKFLALLGGDVLHVREGGLSFNGTVVLDLGSATITSGPVRVWPGEPRGTLARLGSPGLPMAAGGRFAFPPAIR